MSDSPSLDRIVIRPLTTADVGGAWQLSVQAGWNQLAADWQRMLSLEPRGCFAAELDGRIVGTTICVAFGPVAWLAMVLVEETHRGKGLGRRLVQAGLDYADAAGAKTVRLDATPLGRPVYERLGFAPQFELTRWSGVPAHARMTNRMAPIIAAPADTRTREEIHAWDRRAAGADRRRWLDALFADTPPLVVYDERGAVAGFLTSRPGRLGLYVGPCCGLQPAALALFEQALCAHRGERIVVDLPVGGVLCETAKQAGLTPERMLVRMCRGAAVQEDRNCFHLSSGPEFG